MESVNIFHAENLEGRVDVAGALGSREELMFSSSQVPAVSVYPDGDKICVWPGNEADELAFRRGTAVPWSEGEEGWE